MTPDELLTGYPPDVGDTVTALRRLVREHMPEATERVHPGWRGIGYHHPDAGYVCGVFPRDDHARLLFEHGRELADPDGLLGDGGSQTRWMVIAGAAALTPPVRDGIGELIAEAVALRS